MLPAPAAMFVDLNPAAKANLALGNLDLVGLAHRVLAPGPVVGRHLWQPALAVLSDLARNRPRPQAAPKKRWRRNVRLTDTVLTHDGRQPVCRSLDPCAARDTSWGEVCCGDITGAESRTCGVELLRVTRREFQADAGLAGVA